MTETSANPVVIATEQGRNSHYFATVEQLAEQLKECLTAKPQYGLMDQGRELACYIIKMEEFFTPICYNPPASRQILLARDEGANEWLLVNVSWYAGVTDMILPSHLYVDELDMIVMAAHQLSADAKVRIYVAVDILPVTRQAQISANLEEQPS